MQVDEPQPKRADRAAVGRPAVWTREKVLEALRAWARQHGRPPARSDWKAAGPAHPEGRTVYRLFDSWGSALQAAGLQAPPPRPPRRPGGWDQDAVIDAVADWAERFGSAPRLLDWSPALARHAGQPELAELFDSERPRYPTSSRVRQLFGSWHAALGAAEHRSTQSGLKRCSPRAASSAPATHTTAWTQNEALDALRAHHRRHGRAPLYEQWAAADPTGARPSTPTVLALWGSWNEALRQAGLPIRREQPGRRTGPAARRAAAQRYLDGESSTAIAADLGCHPATVLKWAQAAAGSTRPHGRPSGTAGT